MVEREVDVVERVAYLVRDGGGEATHDRRLLGLLDLRFEFAHATELRDHLVEGRGEEADLVAAVCAGDADCEVARGHALRRAREFAHGSSESPDEHGGDGRRYEQDGERRQKRLRSSPERLVADGA